MKKLFGRTMMKMKDNRKNGRKALKGFTLVEIIVVLVILAILAAAMIPALTGYIDKAKDKVAVTEARSVYTAAQTLISEEYAMHGMASLSDVDAWLTDTKKAEILSLADVSSATASIDDIDITTSVPTGSTGSKGKITKFEYTASNGTEIELKTDGTLDKKES